MYCAANLALTAFGGTVRNVRRRPLLVSTGLDAREMKGIRAAS
jgi:hypothetical protein